MLRNMCLCLLLPEADPQVRLDERGHPLRPQHREPAVEAGDRLVGRLEGPFRAQESGGLLEAECVVSRLDGDLDGLLRGDLPGHRAIDDDLPFSGPVVDPGAKADADPGAGKRECRAHGVPPICPTGGSRRTVPGTTMRRDGLAPVMRRSRSNSRATTKQAPQSIASRASASTTASQRLGVMIWNDISATSAIGGRLPRRDSCCATRVSDTTEEIDKPTQIAQAASSGIKTTSAGSCGACHISVATAGLAKSATIARNTPNIRYERPTAGMKIATALPRMSSIRVTGVVSTGSRGPCSRSPP